MELLVNPWAVASKEAVAEVGVVSVMSVDLELHQSKPEIWDGTGNGVNLN